MGVLHQLIKVDRGEYYNLDKGRWWDSDLFPWPANRLFLLPDIFAIPSDLANKIIDMIEKDEWQIKNRVVYAHKLAQHIWDWAQDERLYFSTDSSDYYIDRTTLAYISSTIIIPPECQDPAHKQCKETGCRTNLFECR